MQGIIGVIFLFIVGAFFLSFLMTFIGLLNLIVAFLIAFVGSVIGMLVLSKKIDDPLNVMMLGLASFLILITTGPVFLSTTDFCNAQYEGYTKDFIRRSTPEEWFESGSSLRSDSKFYSRSRSSECETDVMAFMMYEQPILIWLRLTLLLLGIWLALKFTIKLRREAIIERTRLRKFGEMDKQKVDSEIIEMLTIGQNESDIASHFQVSMTSVKTKLRALRKAGLIPKESSD